MSDRKMFWDVQQRPCPICHKQPCEGHPDEVVNDFAKHSLTPTLVINTDGPRPVIHAHLQHDGPDFFDSDNCGVCHLPDNQCPGHTLEEVTHALSEWIVNKVSKAQVN
jgi:hypothetical protein